MIMSPNFFLPSFFGPPISEEQESVTMGSVASPLRENLGLNTEPGLFQVHDR